MKAVLFVASIVLSLAAIAGEEMVFAGDGVTVRLTLAPCEIPALVEGLIAAETQSPPRAAYVTYGKFEIRGCWGVGEEGKVLLGDELGNGGFIPMSSFKRSSGI